MAEPDAGTKLTLLGDTETISPDALPDLYAYPEPLSRCWVRSNFITSLDGGATLDGVSGGLAGPGDRALFKVLRELADVVLVGAGTVRMEHYGGAVLSAAARAARQRRGQAELPPIAIVTASGRLDRDMKVFTASEVTPIVLTSADVAVDTRSRLSGVADVLSCSDRDTATVDLGVVLDRLAAKDLLRVLTEGGPTLHAAFIESDRLDELCLTIAPTLVGGSARRIATGPGQIDAGYTRAHLIADDAGYLYTRYVRA